MKSINNCVLFCVFLVIGGGTIELPKASTRNISPEYIYFAVHDEKDTKPPPSWETNDTNDDISSVQPPQVNISLDLTDISNKTDDQKKPGFSLVPPPINKEENIVLGMGKDEENIVLGMDKDKENNTPENNKYKFLPIKQYITSLKNKLYQYTPKFLLHRNSSTGLTKWIKTLGQKINLKYISGRIFPSARSTSTHIDPGRSEPEISNQMGENTEEENEEEPIQLDTNKNNVQSKSRRYKRYITFENSDEFNRKFYPHKKPQRTQTSKPNWRRKNIYQPIDYHPTESKYHKYGNDIDDDDYNKYNKEIYDDKFNTDYDENNDVYILKPSDYPKDYKPPKPQRDYPICGRHSKSFSQNIVGGTRVALGQYPWMALIQYKGPKGITNGCGGTLISSRYILTAAHCVDEAILQVRNLKFNRIILGEYDTKTEPDCTSEPNSVCADAVKVFYASEILRHYEFNTTNGLLNDIALIKLDREVQFSDYIKPICLPSSNLIFNQNGKESLTVAGWGTTFTKKNVSAKGRSSRILNKVDLPVVDQSFCTNQGVTLTPGQLCVGLGNGMDACQGDSGGPAMLQTVEYSEIVTYQIGIVSYGFSPDAELCGSVPSVNTFVPYYLNWIKNRIK